MRLVGVDLGTRRIAACCPDTLFVWSLDLANTRGKRNFPTELDAGRELGMQLLQALNEHQGLFDTQTIFVAERPLVHHQRPNIRTAVGQGVSAGAALASLPGQVVLLDSPSAWKKELCGNGHADKDEVRAWVKTHQPALAAFCGEVEDRYDAVGIAIGSARLASDGRL